MPLGAMPPPRMHQTISLETIPGGDAHDYGAIRGDSGRADSEGQTLLVCEFRGSARHVGDVNQLSMPTSVAAREKETVLWIRAILEPTQARGIPPLSILSAHNWQV